jgi:hypothetical protein
MGSFLYKPEQADLMAAFKLHYPAFPAKKLMLFLLFAAFVGLSASILSGDSGITETVYVMSSMVAFALITFTILQCIVRFWWMPRYTHRIFKQQADFHQEIEINWDEAYFITQTLNSHVKTAWKDFYHWSRNDQMMLLYRSEALFNFFPINSAERSKAADSMQIHLTNAGIGRRS